MKKKILALVLCLVLCLPFVLTSCFGGGDFNKTISSFRQDYDPSYDTYSTDSFYGTVTSSDGKFFFTKETTENDIYKDVYTYDYYYGVSRNYQDVGTKYTYTYRMYNALTGEVLYTSTTTYESYNYYDYYSGTVYFNDYTSSLTGVSVYEYGEDDMMLPVNDKYLVCNSGIYDINLKLVYSFVENGITNYDVIADNVIIYKNSPVLSDDEILGNVENAAYRYDFETGKLVLVANGYTTRLTDYDYSYYTVYDHENEVYKLYNSKGVIIFASRNYPYVSYTEDTLIIEVEDDANGEDKIYVLK